MNHDFTPVVNDRFHIKWRAFARVSMVMIGVAVSFFIFMSEWSDRRFQNSRNAVHDQYQQQLERLIESSADNMIQLSSAASLNRELMEAINHSQVQIYSSELESLDWSFQTEAGLTMLGFYDLSGDNLFPYGEMGHEGRVGKVLEQERPYWFIDCVAQCRIVTYTALLYRGDVSAVLVLAEPLSNVMLRFEHVANINTGLLSRTSKRENPYISSWQSSLVALTNPLENEAILNRASQDYSLEELEEHVGLIDVNNTLYELKAMPLKDKQVVVISNASQDYSLLNKSKGQTLRMSAVVLFLGEGLLLVLLWRPLKQITRTEELERYVEKQGIILKERTLALDKAQNFSENLCESMSIAVVLIDRLGCIQQVNKFIRELRCVPTNTMVGHPVEQLFDCADKNLSRRIQDVQKGLLDEYEYIGVIASNEQRFRMLWRFVPAGQSEEQCDDGSLRSLLLLGMPLSVSVSEYEQVWIERHDVQTGLLNRVGLDFYLRERIKLKQDFKLMIIRIIPDDKLSPSVFEDQIGRALSEFEQMLDGANRLARLDLNELALLYPFDNRELSATSIVERLDSTLKSHVQEHIVLETGNASLVESDQFPFQIIQRAQAAIH